MGGQAGRVVKERLQPTAHIQKSFGRTLAQILGQLGIEALARWVGYYHLRAGRGQARWPRGTRDGGYFGPIRRVELGESELEPVQRMRTDFVHADLAGL